MYVCMCTCVLVLFMLITYDKGHVNIIQDLCYSSRTYLGNKLEFMLKDQILTKKF